MIFHSQIFIFVFLPLTLALYYSVRGGHTRQWLVIVLSFVFYAWADIRFLPLLVCSILLNWMLAFSIREHGSRLSLWLGIAANLGLIGYFKYKNFFLENLTALTGDVWEPIPVVLPIGISFFTFQQISYLADVRRCKAPVYGLREYAFYVSYFPQLIAGPIVRHNELIPLLSLNPLREGMAERMSRGIILFLIGLVKKFAIADRMAPHANDVFAAATTGTVAMADAWTGVLAFSFQIYFDFSAYSDMAIGLAMMMSLALPENFHAPYRALDIRDFWRRWHMTLSSFLRDYVYIPLGGSRHGLPRQIAAQFITMTLCGLWHGAGWTFLAWGLWHAAGMAINTVWGAAGGRLMTIVAWPLTMLFVIFGWVLFRAETFGAALTLWQAMVGFGADVAPSGGLGLGLATAAAVLACVGPTSQRIALIKLPPWRPIAVLGAIALLVVALEIGKGQPVEFIYFEF